MVMVGVPVSGDKVGVAVARPACTGSRRGKSPQLPAVTATAASVAISRTIPPIFAHRLRGSGLMTGCCMVSSALCPQ